LMSMSVWEGDESLRRRTLPDALLTKVNRCSPFSLQWTDGKRQSVDNMCLSRTFADQMPICLRNLTGWFDCLTSSSASASP
jgi:hypothetical protein